MSLSTHLLEAFPNPKSRSAAVAVDRPANDDGKVDVAVWELIKPPIAVASTAPPMFNSCEIAIVCYANWIFAYIGSHSGSYLFTLDIIALLIFIFLFTRLV